jgi:hypothetical protein
VKYKRPLTNAQAIDFRQAMLDLALLEPLASWRMTELPEHGPERRTRLAELETANIACASSIDQSVAWWKIYSRDRAEYPRSADVPFDATVFRASPHFNNLAYWNFEASIQQSVGKLQAYREKVAALVQAQNTFLKANGKPIKLARKAAFMDVLAAAKLDGNLCVLSRILENYFANPVATSLIAGFAKWMAEGLTPTIDFAFPRHEVTGSAQIVPVGPDFLSDELVEQIGLVWGEFVLGTERLFEESLI